MYVVYIPSGYLATFDHMEVAMAEVFLPLSKNQVNTYYHMTVWLPPISLMVADWGFQTANTV